MSGGPGLAEILVSQLGTPKDHAAQWLGAGVLLLALIAYLMLESGLASLPGRAGRAAASWWRARKDRPRGPFTPRRRDP